jgi:hypothetical protein
MEQNHLGDKYTDAKTETKINFRIKCRDMNWLRTRTSGRLLC